jgi:hypothetical protein
MPHGTILKNSNPGLEDKTKWNRVPLQYFAIFRVSHEVAADGARI